MAFLIRSIDFTAAGKEIVRDREEDGNSLTIGRSTSNAITLPDLAIEQEHLRIETLEGGVLRVSAVGTLGFRYEGRATTGAEFDPRGGGEIALASYRLTFTRNGDEPITITIRQEEKAGDAHDAVRGFALASAMPSKRTMAWIGLGAILIAFLAIPIWSNLGRAEKSPGYEGESQVAMDASWSSGDLSLAHHSLENNCEACHVKPFVAVRDSTCLACHEDVADHAAKPRLAKGRGPMSVGDAALWKVATFFGKEGPEACTTCHIEHEGASPMPPPSQKFCAACHDTLDARLTDTVLGNASDFGTHHPEFVVAAFTKPGQEKRHRVSLKGTPRENHGLRFPHEMHLLPKGGVAEMAINLPEYGAPLDCADCHTPNADKTGFMPVQMEQDCESCHSLVYDRVGSTFRTLRHGDVEQMRADLAAMDRAPRRPIVTGRRRPGEFAEGGRYYQDFGGYSGRYVGITRALSRDGVCGECHIPTITNGVPDVVPVTLPDSYMLTARFDHAAHSEEECTTCHLAKTSESATDLLLPDIAECRTCHMGEDATDAEVPSGCAMCHTYHPSSGKLPGDHPGLTPKTIARITRRTG